MLCYKYDFFVPTLPGWQATSLCTEKLTLIIANTLETFGSDIDITEARHARMRELRKLGVGYGRTRTQNTDRSQGSLPAKFGCLGHASCLIFDCTVCALHPHSASCAP